VLYVSDVPWSTVQPHRQMEASENTARPSTRQQLSTAAAVSHRRLPTLRGGWVVCSLWERKGKRGTCVRHLPILPRSPSLPLLTRNNNKNMQEHYFFWGLSSGSGNFPLIDLGLKCPGTRCREDACCAWEPPSVVSSPRGRLRPRRYREADRDLGLRNALRATSQHSNPPRWGTGLLAPFCAPPTR